MNSLAQNLVDAERVPRENAINQKITKNESRISGYSAITFMMSELKTALSALKDKNSFNAAVSTLSNASVLTATPSVSAKLGSKTIDVQELAKPQKSISQAFDGTSGVNGGAAFSINLSISGRTTTIAIAAGQDTPTAIASAINSANTGVTAEVVNTGETGTPYRVVLTGGVGQDNSFLIETKDSNSATIDVGLNVPSLIQQNATDAKVVVDGVTYFRKTNSIADVVSGVTLDLQAKGVTTLNLSRDTVSIKDKLNKVVTAYNDANNILKDVSDPKSTLDTYGATLVGDSTVRMVRQQLRSMLLGTSSTPGTNVSALWQVGLSIDQSGTLSADATKMDQALTSNFDDVVQALTGGQNNLASTSAVSGGIFGDAVKKITTMIGSTGPLLTQSTNANTQNTRYKEDLTTLQTRMDSLLQRYTKMFSSMENLVGSINSQKASLKSTFDGMMSAYSSK